MLIGRFSLEVASPGVQALGSLIIPFMLSLAIFPLIFLLLLQKLLKFSVETVQFLLGENHCFSLRNPSAAFLHLFYFPLSNVSLISCVIITFPSVSFS